MHCAPAGDEEDMLDAMIGDKLKDVVGEFHHYLSKCRSLPFRQWKPGVYAKT